MAILNGAVAVDSSAVRERLVILAAGTAQTSTASYGKGATVLITGLDGDFSVGSTKAEAEAKTIQGNEHIPVLYRMGNDESVVWVDAETNDDAVAITEV